MENQCQGLLVKSVCAFHYQTTVQREPLQFNNSIAFFSSMGHARPLLLTCHDCDFPKMQHRSGTSERSVA